MAPAFYIPGYAVQEPVPVSPRVVVAHGWNDDVVPVDNSIRYARKYGAELHLLDSDHRLNDQIPMVVCLLGRLLDAVGQLGHSPKKVDLD